MTAAPILVTRVADMLVPAVANSRMVACTWCEMQCWLAPTSWHWYAAGHPVECTRCAAHEIARKATLS